MPPQIQLSEAQRLIVEEASGCFLVRACPGSGKTFTLSARIISELGEWKSERVGMAVLSFTNAAKDELEEQLEKFGYGSTLGYPHILSTIDSFINHYIFMPFAELACAFSGELEMIGQPFGPFMTHSYYERMSVLVKYDITTGPSLDGARGVAVTMRRDILAAKNSLVRRGKFTQADANYYALKILEGYPRIARSIAKRFPVIFVDEAQDSTDIQWRILQIISAEPSVEVFGVIGDPDQAIYGWNGARPELFSDYESLLASDSQVYYLRESRRSSQLICNFYHPLSTLAAPPTAVTPEVKDFSHSPEIWSYPDNDMVALLGRIEEFISATPQEETSFVLCRDHNQIRQLQFANGSLPADLYPWGAGSHALSELFLAARYHYDQKDYHEAYKLAERIRLSLLRKHKKDLVFTGHDKWLAWYKGIHQLLKKLPSTEGTLIGDWVARANVALSQTSETSGVTLKVKRSSATANYANLPISVLFADNEATSIGVQTIHSVKGQTADRVMLILPTAKAKKLAAVYSGARVIDEEIRVIYVALTRARKSVIVCVPQSAFDEVEASMFSD